MARCLLRLFSLLTIFALPLHGAWAESNPVIMGVGDLPGGTVGSTVNAISGDGRTVVGWSGPQAFSWTVNGGIEGGFEPAIPDESTWATDVSRDGSVIVGGGWGYYSTVALLWDAGGASYLAGEDGASGVTVSADGTTVAFSERAFGLDAAYVLTRGQQAVSLGFGLGSNWGIWTSALSGDGSVVVGRSYSDNATGNTSSVSNMEAYSWDALNGLQGLGDLPGGDFASAATDISLDGSRIVGTSASAQGDEAFIWTASGMRGLGDLPGGAFRSSALTISADGSMVGGWSESASGSEAFLWKDSTGMQSLWLLLTALGVDLSDWQSLDTVTGISDDGARIVGTGTNVLGYTEGFVVLIPEPSTALLLGIGLAAIGARQRFAVGPRRSRPSDCAARVERR